MKGLVEYLIEYWGFQTGARNSYDYIVRLTIFCLRQYLKLLTGGKKAGHE